MIEVGEYVKTTDAEIHKIIEIIDSDDELERYYKFENDMGTFEEYILKHSKNIIELIEVGDIVEDNKQIYRINNIEMLDRFKNGDKIISILTKEQYNANCFRLEE